MELLERLGTVVFRSNDIVPERKSSLDLPNLDLVVNPARSSPACTSGKATGFATESALR